MTKNKIQIGADYTHIKTGNVYRVLRTCTNATNAQDGQIMVMYQRASMIGDKNAPMYVRDIDEFCQKFLPCLDFKRSKTPLEVPTEPKVLYNRREFLNSDDKPWTSSIVCFDGFVYHGNHTIHREMFTEISDCHGKIKIHKCIGDSMEDFIGKLELIIKHLNWFIKHLKDYQE